MKENQEIKLLKEKLENRRSAFALEKLDESEWAYILNKATNEHKKREEETIPNIVYRFFSSAIHSYKLSLALAVMLMALSAVVVYRFTIDNKMDANSKETEKTYPKTSTPKIPAHNVGVFMTPINYKTINMTEEVNIYRVF